jgi:hypothetical protein
MLNYQRVYVIYISYIYIYYNAGIVYTHIYIIIYIYDIWLYIWLQYICNYIYSLRINIVQASKWVKAPQLKLNRPFNKPRYTWCQPTRLTNWYDLNQVWDASPFSQKPETRGRRPPIEFGPKLSSWTPQLAGPWVAQEDKTRSQHIGIKLEITRPPPKKIQNSYRWWGYGSNVHRYGFPYRTYHYLANAWPCPTGVSFSQSLHIPMDTHRMLQIQMHFVAMAPFEVHSFIYALQNW